MGCIGIIAGLLEEADSFRPGVGQRDASCPFYLRESEEVRIACAGLGKVNAAMAASVLVDRGCTLLLSFGVAGAIGNQDGVFWIKDALQHDYGSLRNDGFETFRAGRLPFGKGHSDPFLAIEDFGSGLPHARILTGDCFVQNEAQASALGAEHGADLFDMETGAIAQVASMYGIGWAGIRAVSDSIDENSPATFERNLHRAARRAAREADRLMDAFVDIVRSH